MTVEIIEVLRDVGPYKKTLVTFTRDGETFEFHAGRHTSLGRINTLARTLKLEAIDKEKGEIYK